MLKHIKITRLKYSNVVKLDESICSFFENITFIAFDPIMQKYRAFQNEELANIRTAMKQFIGGFENS